MALHSLAEAEAIIRRLEAENARLEGQVQRQQNISRTVLKAVADFGAEVAMDRCSGFGPLHPDAVHGLVTAIAQLRSEHRQRFVVEGVNPS